MAARKIFDVVINSRYTPEGARKALRDLKGISEAGFFIKQGFVLPIQQAAGAIFDLIGAANPERIKELQSAFDGFRVTVGQLLDQALGPTVSEITRIVNQATLLSNAEQNLVPIYDDLIKRLKERGLSAAEMAEEIRKASDSAVEAARREKEANPFHFIGVNAEDFAIRSEQFRAAVLASSKSLEEYIAILRRTGIAIKDLNEEAQAFAQAKGIKLISPEELEAARGQMEASVRQIEQRLTATRMQSAIARGRLLEDIALREADRLADIARQNAQALADIDARRTEAVAQAGAALAAREAEIDRDSARERIRIEEQYQERIRQIKQQSGESIEDAIRRRDARALAQALRQRDQQLGDAQRERDRGLRDQAESAQQQREQARQQAEDQRRAAEDAAREAKQDLQRRSKEAEEEAKRSYGRQLRDFDIAAGRRAEDIERQNVKEKTLLRRHFKDIEREYRDHLRLMARITREESQPGSPLFVALRNFVLNAINDALANALAQTPTGTPTGGR